jgi:7-carboxy-7-deazaguanine synthase
VERANRWPCRFIVLTGGEPLAGPDLSARPGLVDLTRRLRALGKHITIETAGALFLPDLACDLMSISPKLASASPERDTHQADRLHVEAVRRLMQVYSYQLKFVVSSPQEVPEVQKVLGSLGEIAPERTMLMPQASTTEELQSRSPAIAEACKQAGLRFGPRLHLQLWGSRRGV